jgi:hypothetical protein
MRLHLAHDERFCREVVLRRVRRTAAWPARRSWSCCAPSIDPRAGLAHLYIMLYVLRGSSDVAVSPSSIIRRDHVCAQSRKWRREKEKKTSQSLEEITLVAQR